MTAEQLDIFDPASAPYPTIANTRVARPGPAHRDGHDTEVAAAAPGRVSQKVRVLRAFAAAFAGLTDYEASIQCDIVRPHVAGNRRAGLVQEGWPIVDSGARRPTDTGHLAIVWTLTPDGLARYEREVAGYRQAVRDGV